MYHGNVAAMAGRALAARGTPVIWSIHHTVDDLANEPRMTRAVIGLSARISGRVSAITYCARVSARQHRRLGFACPREEVLPNGVDLDEFRPRPGGRERLRALCGFPEASIVLGHVARAHPMKDAAALIRAIALLRERGLPVHAVLIGAGHPGGAVQAQARALGVSAHVTALGARDDVADLLPGLDVFVLCSAWGEAFSLALTEALASGVPAVVTDVGDSAEIVGDAGKVVPPRDPKALAEAIAALSALEPEARRALGLAARRRMAAQFSLERYARRTEDLYRAVLAEGHAGSCR
jgi:glycosyltransferase involved in cell wall biosynthesis